MMLENTFAVENAWISFSYSFLLAWAWKISFSCTDPLIMIACEEDARR